MAARHAVTAFRRRVSIIACLTDRLSSGCCMADNTRMGEEATPPRRGGRLFRDADDGLWYFMTREGRPMGPFDSEEEGRQALHDFLEYVSLADLQQLADLSRVLSPEPDATAIGADAATGTDGGHGPTEPDPAPEATAAKPSPPISPSGWP